VNLWLYRLQLPPCPVWSKLHICGFDRDLFQRGILQPARNQTSDTLVPILLLGHLVGVLPVQWERAMRQLGCLFCRVCTPQGCASNSTDIGDKSVFAYLKEQHSAK